MGAFSSLSERLNHIFSKLTKRGRLTELEIKTAMREVRVALLEADVNIQVAKKFCADVSEKAVGQEILKSLNPAQYFPQTAHGHNDVRFAGRGQDDYVREARRKPQKEREKTAFGRLRYLPSRGYQPA